MNNFLKFATVLMSAGLFAACAGGRPAGVLKTSLESVVSEGSVPYNGGDPAAAAAAAAGEARKNAISAVAELFLDSTAKAEQYDLLSRNLLKDAPQMYVKKHRVLYQGAEEGAYRVRIKAYVFVDKVKESLKGLSLSSRPGRGRKAALAAEEYFNAQPSAAGDFVGAFAGYFKGRSALLFADPGLPADKRPPQLWLDEESNSADTDAFFDTARAGGAGLVFMGKAESFPLSAAQDAQTGFYPARAEARMRVFETDGRKLLLEASGRANALDASQEAAFKKALAATGELLAQDILVRLDKILKPQTPLVLRVTGLAGIEAAQKLKEAVEKLDIAGSAFESYSDGEAVIAVMLKRPDAQEFASALLRTGVFVMDLESVSQLEAVFSLRR